MLINGIDISTLGVELYDRILTSNDVETSQEWLEGDIQPTFIRQQDKFKNLILKFLVLEKNEDAAFQTMSKMTAMLKRATILFDDIHLLFDVSMNQEAKQERLKNGNFILTFNLLSDYAKGETEIYTTDETATSYFNLRVLYYQDGNILIRSETQIVRSSDFKDDEPFSWNKIGIEINKYKPDYYNNGSVTNLDSQLVTYETLYNLQTIIINYAPTSYTKEVNYYLNQDGIYVPTTSVVINYTKAQVDEARNIGDLVDLTFGKPNGYRASTNFNVDLTFEAFSAWSNLQVYYDEIQNEQSKNITIIYAKEVDNNEYETIGSRVINVAESDIVLNTTLGNIINLNSYKPVKYYSNGILQNYDSDAIVTFASLAASYEVRYSLVENPIYVEYYYGTYPNWQRITTHTYQIKYNEAFDSANDIFDIIGVDLDAYYDATYQHGAVFNQSSFTSFDDIINAGVIQVYYVPIEYTLVVNYYQEDLLLISDQVEINSTMFLANPTLGEIVEINKARPEGYIFDEDSSYAGPITLGSLLANSPISIAYKEVEAVRTKSIVVKYKQELASTFSTINTSVLTIEEAQVGGGIRLNDLININAYQPDYYEPGIVDGYSTTTMFTFEEIQGEYTVLYMARTYNTQVRYYTDEIANENWIGSTQLSYTVLDFTVTTTLVDLGLNINAFKPSYCGDGQVEYLQAVTFENLRNTDAINIIYVAQEEPEDPSGIDYPHRILFLQHNDMGDYEANFPTWTLNHAYINTGVTCEDMSKLTVLVDTYRVFEETAPLYDVNVGKSYLFGSVTPDGSYYISYNNNTKYTGSASPTGINTFNIAAGRGTPELVVEETSSEGFSANTGITASTRAGYSYGTLTYTHLVESNNARMSVPLYLFACDMNGVYRGGIAGVGIKSCKIYYDNELIRDFVPVAFFDKIGDKIAPSNCLYDKVTQAFFEDATGLESFNIIDDPDYQDTNPEHNIGVCYANYYQEGTLFNSSTIFFRESDFLGETPWDPYEKLSVDYFQPNFYKSGVILNLEDLGGVTFNNVNGFIFTINYEVAGYNITVNYYQDEVDDANLIASETLVLKETDFLQVPSFGQIVDIQKYKPSGYKPSWNYTDSRVTMRRLLDNAPYNIVYTRVDNPETYAINVRYYREKLGFTPLNPLASMEDLGVETIYIDETEFADGVFVEKFINLNARKPAQVIQDVDFYEDGVAYGWYLQDEMLVDADAIKPEYAVVYYCATIPIEVRYYTDEVEPENLIAFSTWPIELSQWLDGEQFTIVDELPNSYMDTFRPITCWGGQLVNPEQLYTFASLVEQGHIDILYISKEEPHNPDDTDWPSKVLWFNKHEKYQQLPTFGIWRTLDVPVYGSQGELEMPERNTDIPYFNLGYTPKEIGRLRSEIKGYACGMGVEISQLNRYSYASPNYTGFFGYVTNPNSKNLIETQGNDGLGQSNSRERLIRSWYTDGPSIGEFAYYGHLPAGGALQSHWSLPFAYDGHQTTVIENGDILAGTASDALFESVREMKLNYRKGTQWYYDEDLNPVEIYKNYGLRQAEGYGTPSSLIPYSNQDSPILRLPNRDAVWRSKQKAGSGQDAGVRVAAVCFNPLTGIIDAQNDYLEIYDYTNSNHPRYINIDNTDTDVWGFRGKPKGPIGLWITTNPNNGQPNFIAFRTQSYASFYHRLDNKLTQSAAGNPYNTDYTAGYTYTETIVVDYDSENNPIYKDVQRTVAFAYGDFAFNGLPTLAKSMIWYIKLWDQNRLVRDLIPVAAGDHIYDFVAPSNGLFDKVTEIFFGNNNEGGTYEAPVYQGNKLMGWSNYTLTPEDICAVHVDDDPTIWGKIVVNYYDESNEFLGNQYVTIPLNYWESNEPLKDLIHVNDFKPNDFYHDGMIDVDGELKDITDEYRIEEIVVYDGDEESTLERIYQTGSINIYYKLLTFTKTVEYYRGNSRVGSRDIFYTIEDIRNAQTVADLGIDVDLYASDDYKSGRIVFDDTILAEDNIQAFIDAPSPVVIYDEFTKVENPDLLYVNYYRGGAYENDLIVLNEDSANYLDCDLDAKVLNPNGCIKYVNHYHTALYEDEKQDYFIAYQVDIDANYVDIHKGPARGYSTLASITDRGRYTVIEEQRGWGRLREYPRGWINLGYTKPVYGPGQHPTYEVATDLTQVTIPFGTEIQISQLTVDRLWGYVPAYASWIKMEEVSCEQLGKLYNALHQDVIHLDEFDWTTTPLITLADLGIEVNKYKLKYHDNSSFVDSEKGRAQWSDLHSIDIVYPETVYAYNIYYYKDTMKEIPEKQIEHKFKYGIGTIEDVDAFRCKVNLTDTNTYTYSQLSANGSVTLKLKELVQDENEVIYWSFYRDLTEPTYAREEMSESAPVYYVEPSYITLEIEPEAAYTETIPAVDPEIARTSFSCSVSDWTPDWVTFISTSWQTDENDLPINPTLYRDTEIKLTWDFFDVDRNEFKPQGNYDDGLFVWNPRTYENDDIYFTFEELIQTGSQAVIYLPSLEHYKASFYLGFEELHLEDPDSIISNYSLTPQLSDNGHWDIEVKYQNSVYGESAVVDTPTHPIIGGISAYDGLGHLYLFGRDKSSSATTLASYNANNSASIDNKRIERVSPNYGVVNYSNRRNHTSVWYQGNDLTGYQSEKYIRGADGNDYLITDNLNTRQTNFYLFNSIETDKKKYDNGDYDNQSLSWEFDKNSDWLIHLTDNDVQRWVVQGGSQPTYTERTVPLTGNIYRVYTKGWTPLTTPVTYYYVKVWKDFNLVQYWVPVPKGMYLPNGQQVPYNTMYEVLSNTLAIPASVSSPRAYTNPQLYETISGYPIITKLGEEIVQEQDYNWLTDKWTGYISTDIDLVGRTRSKTNVYDVPSEEGLLLTTLPARFVIPLTKQTNDASYGVKGTWMFTGLGWVRAPYVEILPSNSYSIDTVKKTISIKGDTRNTQVTYNAYLAPDANQSSASIQFSSEQTLLALGETESFFYTGYVWVPKSYTNYNVEDINITYAVAVSQLRVYSHPIANDQFLVGARLAGERITTTKRLVKDNYWQYINNEGWVDTFETTSEII